ncbi:protein prenylyltransferase [Rhodotorula sp. JG-1b]|nr:protein prenylyltransferase [Rhodotorula sp. JG-1b]
MSPSLHLHAPHLHLHHGHRDGQQQPGGTAYTDATPKGAHYAATLDTIRRLALWNSAAPALAKGDVNWNAAPTTTTAAARTSTAVGTGGMDWNEVLRKFRKHNPNRSLTAATAATERTLKTLLAKAPTSPRRTANPSLPLPPQIAPADFPAATESLAELRSSLKTLQGTPTEIDSAWIVLAFGDWAAGNPDEALADLAAVTDRGLPRAGVPSEGYDLSLRVLGYAVEGYALEANGRTGDALAAYLRARELYEAAVNMLANMPDRDDNDISLHRMGGDVLMRVALMTRALAEGAPEEQHRHHQLETSYSAHRAYLAHSTSFARSAAAFPPSSQMAMHSSFRSLQALLSRWDPALVSLNDRTQERILRSTTRLPKAGETNRDYLRFLDEVVEGWIARGAPRAGAGEVIEILYNALTHTFQSQLLLRHLIRALAIAGRYDEATKALRLYRELWDKARETDAKEVAKEMRELRARAMRDEAGRGEGKVDVEKEEGSTREKTVDADSADSTTAETDAPYAVDIDSDALFIETVVFGTRLLCRYFGERAADAVDLAKRAKTVFDEAKSDSLRQDGGKIEADLERSLGAALGARARQDPDADRRTKRHSQALEHLHHAASLGPHDPTNQYTLAYHLLEQRQVSEALDRAREAVRLDPNWKEAWHLLALCVSAQMDMKGALAVLETAIELEASDPIDDDNEAARRRDHPTDATERLAVEMQLRLTRNAVIEYLEGPAAALVDQQEILAYFSAEFAPIAAATKALASTQPAPASEQRNRGGLAPPGGGGGASVSRAASVLSRRRSSKKRKSQGLSSAAVSSATVPSRSRSQQAESPNSTGAATTTTAAAAIRPSPNTDRLATKLLAETWLASAASFRRAGKLDEARGAVSEAEALDVDDADVWTQLALVFLATTANGERDHNKVKDVLMRAMAIDPNHVPMSILMARMFLTRPVNDDAATSAEEKKAGTVEGLDAEAAAAPTWKRPLPTDWLVVQVPLAEAMLETIVHREGYDVPEAWYELGRCYRLTGRARDEKECLVRALELERTRPIRVLGRAVQRSV